MSNLYHIMYKYPALDEEDMYSELEELARLLVESGRFRIDADEKINFVRFSLPYQRFFMIFSERELNDPKILPLTKKIIASAYSKTIPKNQLEEKVQSELIRLNKELSKYQKVSKELELKLARIIVQSAHPIVIKMLLIERVEIFLSYGYTIGDMLDMSLWQEAKNNSGMQSTDGNRAAIFVSSGGDPFGENEDKENIQYGHGRPAIARIMVIAGQEIGHYADIMRDQRGRQISRYSADFGARRAKEEARIGRLADIQNIRKIFARLEPLGFAKALELERSVQFYRKNKRKDLLFLSVKLFSYIMSSRLINIGRRKNMKYLKEFCKEKYPVISLYEMLRDMEFNLEPKADAYYRTDPYEKEAIACVEAVARVPQQVNKWGHIITKNVTPNLYKFYYGTIIPGCIKAYESLTNQKYQKVTYTKKAFIFRKTVRFFRNKFEKLKDKYFSD